MKQKKKQTKILFLVMALAAVVLLLPMAVSAEETKPVTAEETKTITKVEPLSESIADQTIKAGTTKGPKLPTNLKVTVKVENTVEAEDIPEEENQESIETEATIPVTWTAVPKLNLKKAGTYRYNAKISEEYTMAEGISLPRIKVIVKKRQTLVVGFKKTYTAKARNTLKVKVRANPSFGRQLKLQKHQSGKWVTKRTYKMPNTLSGAKQVTFTNEWWKESGTKWRIVLPASDSGNGYTGQTTTIKTKRFYQNPSSYIQVKDKIVLKDSGGYNLNIGYMGLKVRTVNNYFHIGNRYWPRYTYQTKSKVSAFQRKKGLKATGIVDKSTWLKMGLSEKAWYHMGAYVSPIKVNPSSTKKQHIEAMISTAYKYMGADYIVGASGTPKQGADCSGLVMQGLYAAGVDPYPVSSVRHSKPGYEYESRNLWASRKLKTVSYSSKKRGDLIFYKGRSGTVIHVAIYLGNGKVIESWPNKVVVWSVVNSHRSRIMGVKRVFN